jgi:hypothetical protein
MTKLIAKPFLWLLTCAIPLFISACYGNGYGLGSDAGGNTELRGKGRVTAALSQQGLADIFVSCVLFREDGEYIYDGTYSLPGDGYFEIWYMENEPCDALRFEDQDGLDNGGSFAPLEVPFDPIAEETHVELELED